MIKGLDVARVDGNTNIDWLKAKALGFGFAIPRAVWGTDQDSIFAAEWKKLLAAGYVRGGYLFLRFPSLDKNGNRVPAPTPKAQAEKMCQVYGDGLGGLPPVMDVEFPGNGAKDTGMTTAQLIAGIMECWDALYAHYGVAPIVYTSARVIREDLQDKPFPARFLKSPLWLARYYYRTGPAVTNPPDSMAEPPVPTQWADPDLWWIHQYQGDATGVPGFNKTVDLNVFNTMSRGAKGARVKWVQLRIGADPDGDFGKLTTEALRRFQAANSLTVDGMIGPKTFQQLCWVKGV